MTDSLPHDEHESQYLGGSGPADQTYGAQPAAETPSTDPTAPQYPSPPQYPGSPQYPSAPQYPGSPQYPSAPQYPAPSYYGASAPPPVPAAAYGPAAPIGPVGDILAAGPVERPRRRLAPILLSAVAVLAVLAAGGGFAAYHVLASKGGQPDVWAPANSVAFGKLDLDPSASEKVAAWQFERKFPHAPHVTSADDLKDSLLSAAFDSEPTHDVNYTNDIKPWLGDRVAFAVYPDAAGQPQTIAIVQIKDAAKAKAELPKLAKSGGPASGYSVQGDYAILGDSQAVVDAAVAAARKSNITSNPTYGKDVAALKGDRVLTAWWDLGATVKLAAAKGMLAPQLSNLGLFGASGGAAGRLVMGVRLQPDYAEVEGRVLGSGQASQLQLGDAGGLLANLPGGTVAGFALANPEAAVKNELAMLQKQPTMSGLQNELDAAGASVGINLPGDLENLLGSGLVVGLDGIPAGGDWSKAPVTIRTEPDDAAKGLDTAKKLAAAGSQAGLPLTASADGSQVVITNDKAPTSGKLSDKPAYRLALGGMPSDVAAAGFVDLSAIWAVDPGVPSDVTHLTGVGFYAGKDATSPVFDVRLTVK